MQRAMSRANTTRAAALCCAAFLTFSSIHVRFRAFRFTTLCESAETVALIVAAVLFYEVFKPANRTIALLMMIFGIVAAIDDRHDVSVFYAFFCFFLGIAMCGSRLVPATIGRAKIFEGIAVSSMFVAEDLSLPVQTFLTRAGAVISLTCFVLDVAVTMWLIIFGSDDRRWQTPSTRGS